MTITLLVISMWVIGMLAVVAVCRSAARGDRAMRVSERRWTDSHERPLVA